MQLSTLYKDDTKVKTFLLPVSGPVVLAGAEIDVIASPEFQRLAGIRQLGTSNVVFRGALHTRFEHSIGSLHQAERMLASIEKNPVAPLPIDDAARRLARLGSLLHDLPHVPFGHTLEDEFHLLKRHNENAGRIRALLENGSIGTILTQALGADEYADLLSALHAKSDEEFAALRYPFVGDIIGNTVCADLLDYVPRDLTACGMPVVPINHCLDYLTISPERANGDLDSRRIALRLDKGGMPRPDVESGVIQLLSQRYELAERVYFHHAKNAASVMIARAVQDAGFAIGENTPEELDENFRRLSDDTLLLALSDPRVSIALDLKHAARTGHQLRLSAELALGVLQRRLYKVAYLAVYDDLALRVSSICNDYGSDPIARRAIEDEFADKAGVARGQVLVHVPRPKMMQKNADVRVLTDHGDVLKLEEWDRIHSHRIEALNAAHERLWRLTVFAHPDVSEAARAILRVAAADCFGAPTRYVEPPIPGVALRLAIFDQEAAKRGWTANDRQVIANPAETAALSMAASYNEVVEEIAAIVKISAET